VIRLSKNKPKETIEFVIRLQDKERKILDSFVTAYMMGRGLEGTGSFMEGIGIPKLAEEMKDPIQMVQIFYSVAMVLEFLGIETGLPTPADAVPYFEQMSQHMEETYGEAGKDSKWWNPASWKIFDFIGDLQADALGVDRDAEGSGIYGFGDK